MKRIIEFIFCSFATVAILAAILFIVVSFHDVFVHKRFIKSEWDLNYTFVSPEKLSVKIQKPNTWFLDFTEIYVYNPTDEKFFLCRGASSTLNPVWPGKCLNGRVSSGDKFYLIRDFTEDENLTQFIVK